MVSAMITTTLEAAVLSAISNLAAQAIKAYREEVSGAPSFAPAALRPFMEN
jgi:hypothetical protein